MKWIKQSFTRRRLYGDLSAEIEEHLAEKADDLMADGMSWEEATQAARREFGNVTLLEERSREVWQWPSIESLFRDVRYGWRMLRRNPGLSIVAVLTLALGIGANTAVFSLVDTILLRPLPYRSPGRLVVVSETVPQMGGDSEIGMAAGEYLDYRDRNRSFAQTAAYEGSGFNLTGEGTPLRVNAAAVTGSVFPLLGVSPQLGRTFTADEERLGSTPVAVLSDSLWRNQYGADHGILGKTIKLDEKPYVVVGVMPPSFKFPNDGAPLSERADLWVPEVFAPDRVQDRLREFGVGFIGRLNPGVSEQQAQSDVTGIANAFMRQYGYSGTVRVVPHVHRFAAYAVEKARPLLMLLIAAVACVHLIACANVANLLLARSTSRGHEMAIRSALGAERRRLLRQCLVESLLLSVAGGLAGFALAISLVDGVRRFGPADVPRLHEVALDPSVLVFTALLAVFTSVLFGLIPAWRLSHTSPMDCLKESSRAGASRATESLQSVVAVAEMATALVLLAGGALVLRSFVRVLSVPLGFNPQGVFIVRTLFDQARYPDPAKRAIVQKQLIDGCSRLHGVRVVAAASHLPLSDTRAIGFRLEHAAPDDFHWAENSLVSPGYFQAMGIPILRGREFTEQDRPNAPLVAVVSQALARLYFPGQNPIGHRFHWGDRVLFTIVGIAGDVRISALDADPPPMIYHSMFQVQSGASARTALILRLDPGRQPDQGFFSQTQHQVWSLDRDLPVYNFTTLETLISESAAERRFTALLMASFAAIALSLALIGLFGVMSYFVSARRRELAIRMALGADAIGVRRMVLRRGAALAVVGCALGLVLFLLGGRVIQATLYATSAYDPATLFSVSALLLGVALLASYLPARRATKVDPMAALRYE